MNCEICGVVPLLSQQSNYSICGACFLAARSLIAEEEQSDMMQINSSVPSATANQNKGLGHVLNWVKEMKHTVEKSTGNSSFLGGFVAALKEGIHADIMVRPGSNGPSIPAHKVVLATRSEIFKNMLDSDKCKAPAGDTITLEELNHEELEAFLEFLYTGDLAESKMEKHVYSLTIAADKYEIALLQKNCEHHMLGSLSSSNVLDILEVADFVSLEILKEAAINFIVNNIEEVISSPRFDVFALKNPHLHVKITRACFGDIRNRNSRTNSSFGDYMSSDLIHFFSDY